MSLGRLVVEVTNPHPMDCVSVLEGELTVIESPEISQIDPPIACVSESDRQFLITGTNFLVMDGVMPEIEVDGQLVTLNDATDCTSLNIPKHPNTVVIIILFLTLSFVPS